VPVSLKAVVLIVPKILSPVPVMLTSPPFVVSTPSAENVVATVAFRLTLSASLTLETVL